MDAVIAFLKIAYGLVMGLIALVFLWADPWQLKAPTDATLVATFAARRPEFERVLQMMTEDGEWYATVLEVAAVPLNNPVRKQEYRRLLWTIHPLLTVRTGPDHQATFSFAEGGDWSKGIVYVPSEVQPGVGFSVRPTLDNTRLLPVGWYYRRMVRNWYIFYERSDD